MTWGRSYLLIRSFIIDYPLEAARKEPGCANRHLPKIPLGGTESARRQHFLAAMGQVAQEWTMRCCFIPKQKVRVWRPWGWDGCCASIFCSTGDSSKCRNIETVSKVWVTWVGMSCAFRIMSRLSQFIQRHSAS